MTATPNDAPSAGGSSTAAGAGTTPRVADEVPDAATDRPGRTGVSGDPVGGRGPSPGTPTRASGTWTAAIGALLLLLLLAVFVGQNAHGTDIEFLGWRGRAPTAALLLVAAVAGGALVAVAGIARILQLRRRGRAVAGGPPGAG